MTKVYAASSTLMTLVLGFTAAAQLSYGAAFTSIPSDVCPAPYSGSSDGEGVSSGYIADTMISGYAGDGHRSQQYGM